MSAKSNLATLVCVCVAWSAACSSLRAILPPEEIYAAALPSTLTLEVENAAGKRFIGSAFLAVGEGLAVTAWHVIHDAQRIEACFSDKQRVPVMGIVDKDEDHDLALIRLASGARPRIALSSGVPRIGSRIYVIGAPRGFGFSFSDGLISQIRTLDGVEYYQVSCPISPGDSGGPVLNDHGEAVGVMSWRKADAENVSFAVPTPGLVRLNAAKPLSILTQNATLSQPQVNDSESRPFARASVTAPGREKSGGLGEFKKLLSQHAGKRLTVVVQEGGAENRFTFEVPREMLK